MKNYKGKLNEIEQKIKSKKLSAHNLKSLEKYKNKLIIELAEIEYDFHYNA